MMKHGMKLSILALALAGTGFGAIAADEITVTQTGDRNGMNYDSLGGNTATVEQVGNDNAIFTGEFTGAGNTATMTQSGDANEIFLNDNSGTIGADNTFTLNQAGQAGLGKGEGQLLEIETSGVNNTIDSLQQADSSISTDRNQITVNLGGDSNMLDLDQNGADNSQTISALDYQNSEITVNQTGEGNITTLTSAINVTNNSLFSSVQSGQGNSVTGAMTSADNASISSVQYGASNMVNATGRNLSNTNITFNQGVDGDNSASNIATASAQSVSDSTLTSTQVGTSNTLDIDVFASDNITYDLNQDGAGNRIDYASSYFSSDSSLTVDQNGNGNLTFIIADGVGNDFNLTQNGDSNDARLLDSEFAGNQSVTLNVTQNSIAETAGNDLILDQSNVNLATVDFTQTGDQNTANVALKNANDLDVDVIQDGEMNSLSLIARNGQALIDIEQLGTNNGIFAADGSGAFIMDGDNSLTVTQDGANNRLLGSQVGSGNSIMLTQSGAGDNLATVTQDGMGNVANITQGGMNNAANITQLNP